MSSVHEHNFLAFNWYQGESKDEDPSTSSPIVWMLDALVLVSQCWGLGFWIGGYHAVRGNSSNFLDHTKDLGVLHRCQHCTGHITTYSSSGFRTVNCRPAASNYQLSHLRPCQEPNPGLRVGRRECNHSATVAPTKDLGAWNIVHWVNWGMIESDLVCC